MSASSKKKLRNEQEAAKLTERQLNEQREAKKLRVYTTIFVVVLAALLVTALWVGISNTVANSGIREKNTTAMTVGSREVSNAELNYFFIGTVNNFYSSNGAYLSMIGVDTTKPLNEQMMDEAAGQTWADYFLNSAKETARSTYVLADAAKAAGHALSEDEMTTVNNAIANQTLYATIYGYSDVDSFLKASYGKGASEKGYREYVELSTLANSYYAAHADSLVYEDAQLREKESENYNAFSSFTYNYYYLAASRFLEGGTTAEDGTVTYSDEEKAASVKAAEEAANSLIAEEILTAEDLDAAISALEINAGASVTSTSYTDTKYASVSSSYVDWIADESRKAGDKTAIANVSTADDGTETVNGYYVLLFLGRDDNTFALKNVRHILVGFEGGTTDENGATTYTDEEKAAAKTKAEDILKQWQDGDATEESFAALAAEKTTDTGSIDNGGLYEDVYPGQMVKPFEDWCYDAARNTGDTGLVESDYGCYIMYFVGDSQTSYRDHQIKTALVTEDMNTWYTDLLAANEIVDGSYGYIRTDLVLNANG